MLDVIYDGQCRFCKRSLDRVERLARRPLLRLHDANDREMIRARFPMLADEDTDHAMFVVTSRGEVFRGFFAYRRMLWESRRLYAFLPLFYAPGAALVGPWIYAWVARNRRHFGCSLDAARSCGVASPGATLRKGLAGGVSVLLMGATVAPLAQNWRAAPKDSFPFSYYPMFSQARKGRYVVTYLVGLDRNSARHTLSHEFAGNGGFNQTRRQINKLVRDGKADALCRSVAGEVAQAEQALHEEDPITAVQVVTGTFRLAEYFGGNKTPAAERVRAACRVAHDAELAGAEP